METEKSPSALRTIGEVADELGVATHVLRFWESKFNQIKPQKRRGRRYYRPEDITTITQIKALLYGQGYTIRGVQKFLAEGRHKLTQTADNMNQPVSQTTASVQQQAPIDSRPRDLFGNLISAAEEDQEVQAGNDNALSSADKEKLQEIYQGLCATRDKLKQVA